MVASGPPPLFPVKTFLDLCRASGRDTNYIDGFIDSADSVASRDAAFGVLDDALCSSDPHPIIVAVTGSDGSYPGHFVLVTGRDGDIYTIADPATGTMRTLDDYGNKFQTRGSVMDPIDTSGLNFSADNNVSLLVTDSSGHHTGSLPASTGVLQQIPRSSYFTDKITDGDVGGIDTTGSPEPESHLIQIFQPVQSTYIIVLTGTKRGPYTLRVDGFDQDGSPQAPVVLKGMTEQGAHFTYQVKYASAPGSTSSVLAISGDRNGDGVVNCADLDIVKASFGKKIGQAGFDPRADVNSDGIVNVFDLSTVARQLPAGTVCQ